MAARRRGEATVEAVAALGPLARPEASLAPLCTYRVGGAAAGLVEVDAVRTLERVREVVEATGVDILVIGRGSNLLVADAGFDGLVLQLASGLSEVVIDPASATVRAGAAALLPVVARKASAAGLVGFEWAVGVPGSVGGAVRMNAGGHGSDMAASLRKVEVVDAAGDAAGNGGSTRRVAELELGYRSSSISQSEVVLSAELQLSSGDPVASQRALAEVVAWRRANQPGGQNAGSVFANPPEDSAGRLIEAAGLKGWRLGSAQVSEKHANFIQADPNGSANDVYALIQQVQHRVLEEYGVALCPENRLIGFGTPQ